jgi:cytochrome oxidase assembly protein ShyY1
MALVSEEPAVSPTPLLLDRPVADEGPHLSYTFQWFLFGILGFVAWGYLLREDYRGETTGVKRRTRQSDQDEEDALLDAWEKSL